MADKVQGNRAPREEQKRRGWQAEPGAQDHIQTRHTFGAWKG